MTRRRRVLVSRPHPVDRASALEASFDCSQFPAVTCDGCSGVGQQRSQMRLGQQFALDLQDQPPEVGAIGNGHALTLPAPVGRALSRIAHINTTRFRSARLALHYGDFFAGAEGSGLSSRRWRLSSRSASSTLSTTIKARGRVSASTWSLSMIACLSTVRCSREKSRERGDDRRFDPVVRDRPRELFIDRRPAR